jgi:hypothetical protein
VRAVRHHLAAFFIQLPTQNGTGEINPAVNDAISDTRPADSSDCCGLIRNEKNRCAPMRGRPCAFCRAEPEVDSAMFLEVLIRVDGGAVELIKYKRGLEIKLSEIF